MDTPENREAPIRVNFGAGLHAAAGHRVDDSAYYQYIGRWSRLFVPAVLAAAEVGGGYRVLDVATGPGEAAAIALSRVGPTGLVVGVDISPAMLDTARTRFGGQRFRAAAMDAQALAFPDATFDCVVCQLGLMFFPDPARGVAEFRRVLRPGRRAAVTPGRVQKAHIFTAASRRRAISRSRRRGARAPQVPNRCPSQSDEGPLRAAQSPARTIRSRCRTPEGE